MNKTFECDTKQLRDTAKEVIGYVNDLKVDVNKLYFHLDDLKNEAWVGKNAEDYSRVVLTDKPDYIDFMDGVKAIADEMNDLADELEDTTNKCEREAEGI